MLWYVFVAGCAKKNGEGEEPVVPPKAVEAPPARRLREPTKEVRVKMKPCGTGQIFFKSALQRYYDFDSYVLSVRPDILKKDAT
jgi:hypothetical protein